MFFFIVGGILDIHVYTSRHIVTVLLVKMQHSSKNMCKAVERPSIRLQVISIIKGRMHINRTY